MKNKRSNILAAAEEILTQKSITEATISEIAAKANVADSVIYQFFKGKEDLLFSIPGEKMVEVLEQLDDYLEGIIGAESRLSKMIWFHLKFNDTNRGYARILHLECRSSPDFYHSKSYKLMRKYAGVMMSILDQGVSDGAFRPDLETGLIRDLILGTLDWETITCLATGETKEMAPDLNKIIDLLHPMLVPHPVLDVPKHERILQAAVKVFAAQGFARAKVSDIAKQAGVAEGTVYEYFKNKEGLLLSIPFAKLDNYASNLEETFQITNPARKLRRLIKYHFSHFLSDRDFLKVFIVQLQLNERFYGTPTYDRFRNCMRLFEDVIEEGQASGDFRKEVSPRVFRNMVMGAFSHMALRWLILDQNADKMQEIESITKLLSLGVAEKETANT